MTSDRPARILFVCLGNICRSPLAESVFRHIVGREGMEDRFEIDSAGTSGYHIGEPPDSRTVAIARERGVEVIGSARQLGVPDLGRFDYIIAMDAENLEGVRRLGGGESYARIHLLREWDPEEPGGGVPDPYFGGERGFEDVHDIVERSCEALYRHILEERAWS